MPKKQSVDYQTLSQQLNDVLAKLQAPNVRVDEAVTLYGQGLKLIAQMESVLSSAENTIHRLALQATGGEGPHA
ncbi:MAG TPA: exodeoxyribonuclease VII small subunit [Candidatus Saccharimonadales bacterium]|nr:exodeoxyribonuclease VII small subunit [Candidatus Saccharimonadales bacterium]